MKRFVAVLSLIPLIAGLLLLTSCHKAEDAASLRETGESQLADKDYAHALVTLSRAETLAKDKDDEFELGKIYRLLGETYNATGSYSDAIESFINSVKAYQKAEKPANARQSLYEAGIAYYNVEDYSQAEQAFRSVIHEAHEAKDSLMESSALSAYAGLCLEEEVQAPSLTISILGRIKDELGFKLSSREEGMLAYSYSLLGNNDTAEKWLRIASKDASTPEEKNQIQFRQYQISSREGDYKTALSALEEVMEYNNKIELGDLKDSVMRYQKSYFREQNRTASAKLHAARLKIFLIIAVFMAILFSLLGYFRARKVQTDKLLEEEKQEREKYMSLAEELKDRLKTTPRFNALERLCEKYYVYEGTDNLQPKILGEVKSIIDGLRDDPKELGELERMLNQTHDNIVGRFKAQMPKMKDDDIRIFVFAASGLSSTAMSTLLELDKPVVYNRIYRLKGRIAKSEAPDKDEFLEMLND